MSEESTVAKEIERKYRLSGLPKDIDKVATAKFRVDHGWLPGNVIRERITHSSKSGKFWRVIKTGKGLERIEAQEEISLDLFTKLWPLTVKQISKTRWHVPADGGLVWEVDKFDYFYQPMAEIEIPSVNTTVKIPDWLSDYVLGEVTDDPAFENYNMAFSKDKE